MSWVKETIFCKRTQQVLQSVPKSPVSPSVECFKSLNHVITIIVIECVQTLYFCFQRYKTFNRFTQGFFLPIHIEQVTFLCALSQVYMSGVARSVGYLDDGISLVLKFLQTYRLLSDVFYTRPLHTQPLHTILFLALDWKWREPANLSFFFLHSIFLPPTSSSHLYMFVHMHVCMSGKSYTCSPNWSILGQIRQMHRHVRSMFQSL